MIILVVFLIFFGSFSEGLFGQKCRFDRIYNEVFEFCYGSNYPGCDNDLNKFSNFLNFFLKNTKVFCNLPRFKRYCKPCSLNSFSWNDLVSGGGTDSTGNCNGSNPTENGTSSTGNSTQETTP